jgi:putative membrane protein
MPTTAIVTELAAHPGYGWGGGGFGWLFLLIPLFWIVVLVTLFTIFGRRWRRGWNGHGPYPYGHGQTDARSAEKTLAERFAQGDIDEVEYRARLEVLRANRPEGPPAR